MMFEIGYSGSAKADLRRIYTFLLQRASTLDEVDAADEALLTISLAVEALSRAPFLYRKAEENPFQRELIIPFGSSGYVVLFEIVDNENVTILAVRHQLEDDYH